jgi:hypothetical protein
MIEFTNSYVSSQTSLLSISATIDLKWRKQSTNIDIEVSQLIFSGIFLAHCTATHTKRMSKSPLLLTSVLLLKVFSVDIFISTGGNPQNFEIHLWSGCENISVTGHVWMWNELCVCGWEVNGGVCENVVHWGTLFKLYRADRIFCVLKLF